MTDPFDGDITTNEEFEAALATLLTMAHENGLTVERPWLARTDDGYPDWEANIVELDSKSTGES